MLFLLRAAGCAERGWEHFVNHDLNLTGVLLSPWHSTASLPTNAQPCWDYTQVKAEVEDLQGVLDDLWEKVDELKEAARSRSSTKASLRAAFNQIAAMDQGAPGPSTDPSLPPAEPLKPTVGEQIVS